VVWIAVIIGVILLIMFPKQIGVLIAVLLVLLGAIFLYIKLDQDAKKAEKDAVSIEITYGSPACAKEYPLAVNFKNGSKKTVSRIKWNVAAYKPGYSGNVAIYGSYSSSYDTPYESDRILEPNQSFGLCYTAPPLKDNASREQVRWEAINKVVYFAR